MFCGAAGFNKTKCSGCRQLEELFSSVSRHQNMNEPRVAADDAIKSDSADQYLKFLSGQFGLVHGCTLGQRFHCDLLAVVAVTGSRHRHHPDAVLPVSRQIGDSVEICIRRGLELAHHLWSAERKEELIVLLGITRMLQRRRSDEPQVNVHVWNDLLVYKC